VSGLLRKLKPGPKDDETKPAETEALIETPPDQWDFTSWFYGSPK